MRGGTGDCIDGIVCAFGAGGGAAGGAGTGMCIGAVTVCPGGGGGGTGAVVVLGLRPGIEGGGGGAARSACEGGGPDRNCAAVVDPFVFWPSEANAPESVAVPGAGVPAAGGGALVRGGGGCELMIASMLARSGSRCCSMNSLGSTWPLSLSKTWVASSSSSQSMSRFDPFFAVTGPALFTGGASGVAFAFPLCGGDETGEIPGRVLSGGGGTCGETCVVAKPGGALDFGGTLGSVLRPGGGGGLLGDGELAGGSPLADGLVEGGEGRGSGEDEDPGGGGLGIPTSVFFASVIGAIDPGIDGGGGGAAGDRSAVFFPRPSKMSRSEPPLLSSDIRVS